MEWAHFPSLNYLRICILRQSCLFLVYRSINQFISRIPPAQCVPLLAENKVLRQHIRTSLLQTKLGLIRNILFVLIFRDAFETQHILQTVIVLILIYYTNMYVYMYT